MKIQLMIATLILGCSSPRPIEHPKTVETPVAEVEANEKSEDPTIELGRVATRMFYEGEVEPLHARFSEPMLQVLPAADWAQAQSKTVAELGAEIELLDEATSELLGNRMYYRTVRFENVADTKLVVTWAFDADGTITGFNIQPLKDPAPSQFLDYHTKTPLRLPFDGAWTVLWGGRTLRQNYHGIDATQRFALDLLVTGEDHRSHHGDPAKNENYLAFGKTVFAPGAGEVIAMENSVPDNTPGEMNPAHLAGNFVLIDHGDGEYSLLAHFKQGSVQVKVGDRVTMGQVLGLCGNSGNSSEPHIHYHLQNSAEPLKGDGLPIEFEAAIVDGERREKVELVQGQRVSLPPE